MSRTNQDTICRSDWHCGISLSPFPTTGRLRTSRVALNPSPLLGPNPEIHEQKPQMSREQFQTP